MTKTLLNILLLLSLSSCITNYSKLSKNLEADKETIKSIKKHRIEKVSNNTIIEYEKNSQTYYQYKYDSLNMIVKEFYKSGKIKSLRYQIPVDSIIPPFKQKQTVYIDSINRKYNKNGILIKDNTKNIYKSFNDKGILIKNEDKSKGITQVYNEKGVLISSYDKKCETEYEYIDGVLIKLIDYKNDVVRTFNKNRLLIKYFDNKNGHYLIYNNNGRLIEEEKNKRVFIYDENENCVYKDSLITSDEEIQKILTPTYLPKKFDLQRFLYLNIKKTNSVIIRNSNKTGVIMLCKQEDSFLEEIAYKNKIRRIEYDLDSLYIKADRYFFKSETLPIGIHRIFDKKGNEITNCDFDYQKFNTDSLTNKLLKDYNINISDPNLYIRIKQNSKWIIYDKSLNNCSHFYKNDSTSFYVCKIDKDIKNGNWIRKEVYINCHTGESFVKYFYMGWNGLDYGETQFKKEISSEKANEYLNMNQ